MGENSTHMEHDESVLHSRWGVCSCGWQLPSLSIGTEVDPGETSLGWGVGIGKPKRQAGSEYLLCPPISSFPSSSPGGAMSRGTVNTSDAHLPPDSQELLGRKQLGPLIILKAASIDNCIPTERRCSGTSYRKGRPVASARKILLKC